MFSHTHSFKGVEKGIEGELVDSLNSLHLGTKRFLSKHLGPCECLLVWNVPVVLSQSLSVLIVYRDVEDDCYPVPDDKTHFRRLV